MRHLNTGENLQNGRYTINSILGAGGFGITYLATENPSNEQIAIKTLNATVQGKDNFLDLQNKFIKEAFLLAKCSHPHIVTVHNVFEKDGFWYMVMEYIKGDDLAVYLQKNGVFNEANSLPIIQQIGEALSYIHSQGFLHRDVKPNNILLSINTVKLIDFGIAREFTAGETRTHTNYRKDGYSPPEQYEERAKRGIYTDVYALAATLYNLLTDEVPIPAQFRSYATLPPPQQFNNKISDRVNNAILKGMELKPESRPQTIQEFLYLLLPKPVQIPQPKKDDLSSDRGVDYSKLRDLLKAGKWEEADICTVGVIYKATNRKGVNARWHKDIDNLPCTDLRTINQLWLDYSGGKFGFSVQKEIYHRLGGTRHYNEEIWIAFGDAVGWCKGGSWLWHDHITYNTSAPVGHLPSFRFFFYFIVEVGGDGGFITSLLSREDL
ncbi:MULTISPECIES: serine/threonine-protein kinase [Crocosphaera]|uniref:Serine/threonine kinase n=2 Tax=Crocosphaera watsonii TaxID=263511 RepID=G5J519_CROWT|nr:MULTISPECIES: serine/threonine-protein kinase [Crocosphaera]EHJ12752.1 serine/threonine kinase [Crocosphaera watsonii WH 0003]MCH2243617.1 serine/threonine-protein kinase [Crocosphaera sp.]CCQ58481.1 serine/threonine kinase [Crocosphaera watsonii WH 0005]